MACLLHALVSLEAETDQEVIRAMTLEPEREKLSAKVGMLPPR